MRMSRLLKLGRGLRRLLVTLIMAHTYYTLAGTLKAKSSMNGMNLRLPGGQYLFTTRRNYMAPHSHARDLLASLSLPKPTCPSPEIHLPGGNVLGSKKDTSMFLYAG